MPPQDRAARGPRCRRLGSSRRASVCPGDGRARSESPPRHRPRARSERVYLAAAERPHRLVQPGDAARRRGGEGAAGAADRGRVLDAPPPHAGPAHVRERPDGGAGRDRGGAHAAGVVRPEVRLFLALGVHGGEGRIQTSSTAAAITTPEPACSTGAAGTPGRSLGRRRSAADRDAAGVARRRVAHRPDGGTGRADRDADPRSATGRRSRAGFLRRASAAVSPSAVPFTRTVRAVRPPVPA